MILAFPALPLVVMCGLLAPSPTVIALVVLLAGSVVHRRLGGSGL